MELTQSAFNLFLDMTDLKQVDSTNEQVDQQQQSNDREQHSSSVEKQGTQIQYFDGQTQCGLTRSQLVTLIKSAPSKRHLVWVPKSKKWKSWREITPLFNEVMAALTSADQAQAPQPEVKRTPVDHHKAQEASSVRTGREVSKLRQVEVSSHQASHRPAKPMSVQQTNRKPPPAPSYSIEQRRRQVTLDQVRPVAKRERHYLSVPETVFTHFDIDLTHPNSATPFVGLSNQLTEGGLLIWTERAFHVGDYIQVKVRVAGRTLLKFEAPITVMYCATEGRHGVAVHWPRLSPAQRQVIERSTSQRPYEFLVA